LKKLLVALAATALAAALLGTGAVANSGQQSREKDVLTREEALKDGVVDSGLATTPDDDQHGEADGHLPPRQKNIKLVSRLKLTDTPRGIADVHYYKGYAYLAAWAPECPNGGIHVVDVRNPRQPKKVGFIPSGAHDYVGEGVHAMHIKNNMFEGDVLLVNHEACDAEGKQGISLWDISNPKQPWPLAKHTGDFDTEIEPGVNRPDSVAHSVHSVLGWTAGRKAFAVLVDNNEAGGRDVDIMDISNPGRPRMIAETGIDDWPEVTVDANGESVFHHDVWHKVIDGRHTLGVSYWDAGWVFLDVNDPSNPEFIYDTNYPETDLLGFSPPEGNGHQGEWSKNAKYWLGSDEDFAPFRSKFEVLTGANAGEYAGAEFGWTVPIAINFTEDKAEGTTVWGGSGCLEDTNGNGISDRDEVPDASDYDEFYEEGEERILVLSRGTCFFSIKVESGQLKGWDMVIVGNSHGGSGNGSFPDAYLCGSQGHDFDVTASGGCTGHRAMHLIFNSAPAYVGPDGADMPPIGTVGDDVRMTSEFDGWGYLNLYNYRTGRHKDAFAVKPAIRRDRAFGFGTLSIHEVATDMRRGKNLGYISWYAAGLQVVKFGSDGIKPAGVYRHAAGNDFWGVSLQKRGKNRPLIYMSDRDSGLWVFKYTGKE